MCTVSGFTVIDFHHRVHFVPDRCDYTLVSSDGGPHGSRFYLEATFRERRRKDVPFLDYLRLNVSGVQIYLEQGGRVSVSCLSNSISMGWSVCIDKPVFPSLVCGDVDSWQSSGAQQHGSAGSRCGALQGPDRSHAQV